MRANYSPCVLEVTPQRDPPRGRDPHSLLGLSHFCSSLAVPNPTPFLSSAPVSHLSPSACTAAHLHCIPSAWSISALSTVQLFPCKPTDAAQEEPLLPHLPSGLQES